MYSPIIPTVKSSMPEKKVIRITSCVKPSTLICLVSFLITVTIRYIIEKTVANEPIYAAILSGAVEKATIPETAYLNSMKKTWSDYLWVLKSLKDMSLAEMSGMKFTPDLKRGDETDLM